MSRLRDSRPAEPGSLEPLRGEELEQAKEELTDFVLAETGGPVDRWAVAATLEIGGLRDLDAATRFGAWDIFDLADDVYARCRARLEVAPPVSPARSPGVPRSRRLVRFVRLYLYGAFFIVPLAIQIASLLILGYSQWASLHFSDQQASIVVVAIISSLVLTGGFVQALGYLGPLFLEPREYILTRRVVSRVLGLGILFAAASGGAWWLANLVLSVYSEKAIGTGLVYYMLTSGIWLTTSVLYMLRKFLAMVLSNLGGIGVVALIVNQTTWGIYAAHWIGLATSIAIALVWAAIVLARRAHRTGGATDAQMPRPRLLAYRTGPYFAYGLFYFGLLFADRLVGWSAGDHPLPVWFRAAYEVGLDWALVALVLGIAFLEYTANVLPLRIVDVQQRFGAERIRDHNFYFIRFYLLHLTVLVVLAGGGIALSYEGALSLRRYHALREIRGFFTNSVTHGVFVTGAIAYTLLACGLLSGLLLFSFSRPKFVLRAVAPAVATSLAVGIPLSRSVDYWYSVVGLAAGTFVFAVISGWYALRVLSRADYYYFAAY